MHRTPASEARLALNVALRFWVAFVRHAEKKHKNANSQPEPDPERYFIDKIFGVALSEIGDTGEALEAKLLTRDDTMLPEIMMVSVAYAADALKAYTRGETIIAWSFASDANYWAGVLHAAWASKSTHQSKGSALAEARHAQTTGVRIKAAVDEWLADPQPPKSMTKAAEPLAIKHHLSQRTVYEALLKANKKRK